MRATASAYSAAGSTMMAEVSLSSRALASVATHCDRTTCPLTKQPLCFWLVNAALKSRENACSTTFVRTSTRRRCVALSTGRRPSSRGSASSCGSPARWSGSPRSRPRRRHRARAALPARAALCSRCLAWHTARRRSLSPAVVAERRVVRVLVEVADALEPVDALRQRELGPLRDDRTRQARAASAR